MLVFSAVVALTYATPGPDFAVIVRYSTQGRRLGNLAALGVVGGMCVHLTAANIGLSAVLMSSTAAFTAVKLLGAGYLLFLGLTSLLGRRESGLSKTGHADVPSKPDTRAGRRAFARGALTNLSNPKTALFFLSLIPQFVDPAQESAPQLLLLGIFAVAYGAMWWLVFVTLVDKLRTFMDRPMPRQVLDRLIGVALIGLSIRLLRTPPAAT
ncbi:LysE family translocator [Saccharopolyspora terrae]|uniref:LysE family translocator n=1 Tax=Saccharopolyspora terrae TaxID=2530384 RepID=A0A4R4VE45_9PSEU|nr:LysE family translocator [Saccharopolyspora terrae]